MGGGKTELRWTEQQGKIAKRLCFEGKTAAEIAVEVGKTRNAVIGYLHRNGIRMNDINGRFSSLKPRAKPVRVERVGGVIHRKVEKKVKKPPILKFDAIRTKDGVMGIPFLKAGPNQCRYIIEDRPAIICGEPTKSVNCSWCEGHYGIVFTKDSIVRQKSQDRRATNGQLGWNRSSFMAQGSGKQNPVRH
jgi:hypothetical protein